MDKFDALNEALYNADLFGTNCKENEGMENEYAAVAEALIEEGVQTEAEFFESLDFWQYDGFTESMGGSEVFQNIQHIL